MKFVCFLVGMVVCASGSLCLGADEEALALSELVKPTADASFPLPDIVHAISGYRVLPWNGELKAELEAPIRALAEQRSKEHFTSSRVNEVGQQMEHALRESLAQAGFTVDTPRTQSGRRQSAGYPDLEVRKGDQLFYLEVKCFSAHTRNSTQRSFYLSPSGDPKITGDAFHLLVGFELKEEPEDCYRVSDFEVLDLSKLRCEVKIEFNASNRDLYDNNLTVIEAGE